MRKLLPMLRLHFEADLSIRQIAASLKLSVGVVSKYLARARECNLSWPLADNIDESKLSDLLKASKGKKHSSPNSDAIDFAKAHQELRTKGVTLQLLWEEYVDTTKTPLSYSRYCFHYRKFKKSLSRSMRQNHHAGDKVFIDYSGKTLDIIDPDTGKIRSTEIFVGVLGASGYTYVEATWTQQLPDFLSSGRRMLEFFGGVPALLVPDNLKSAVSKCCRYEPEINVSYAQFAEHYNAAVLPARPYRPKDKPKAECGVQLAQRWILAKLRHCTFVGLAELNREIKILLSSLNKKPFQKLEGSRESCFLAIDKPALKPLPAIAYEYKKYKSTRAGKDYHINIDGHYYSVPHQYCGELIDVWFNQNTVTCYFQGDKIAMHIYSGSIGNDSTLKEHMPVGHQKHSQQSPERYLRWAGEIGVHTQSIVRKIIESKSHPEQAYKSCLSLLNIAKKYTEDRLEKSCRYAWNRGIHSRKSIISIIENKLDLQPDSLEFDGKSGESSLEHENIRGSIYYS